MGAVTSRLWILKLYQQITWATQQRGEMKNKEDTESWLTGYFQRCITADSFSQVVPGHADIGSLVRFAPSSMNDAKEEKWATEQQHALWSGIVPVCFNTLSILVPLHRWGRPPLCFTVESGRLPFGNNQVRWVLHNPGWGVLLAQTGSWSRKKKCN